MVAATDEEYGTDDAAIPVASDVIRSTILRFALPLEIPGDKPCAEALLTPVRASDAPPQLVVDRDLGNSTPIGALRAREGSVPLSYSEPRLCRMVNEPVRQAASRRSPPPANGYI